ncbi:TIGR02677 family protein [Actinomadura mexicana]|uniref:TIGR02677 family protein n=1 Tax=Actinomadura mexicana TaxID=134959 RepID=A0A239BG87_9ACTN|nr:TIGR02677 family protein [Actinomadura mexicana]SNS06368.1 TIGR02677 family protein [Actinomadura mexicana]
MGLPRVPEGMFSFTTTERADLHTAVMYAFGEANERLETSLTFGEVREWLRTVKFYAPVDDASLTRTLEQLVKWKLLDVVQNHAGSYATAEEYERKNLQYSLTQRGEAAFAGVQHALAVLSSSGALQTAVLDAIADRLGELGELLKDGDPAVDRRIFTTLQELEGHLDALRNNTRSFNGELQRLMRAEGADLATFNDVKSATVAYLQEFVTNLETRADAVHTALGEVEERGVSVLHGRALRGAELPPAPGADPAIAWLAARRAKWEGLLAWFRPGEGTPRVRQLHDVARRAIVSLLQVLDRITESRRRSSSAAADFRTLARWFANAPTEEDAHRLWGTAFGLTPARHAHLAHADAEPIPTAAGWAETPPVEVSVLLRTSGRTERIGRTAKVRDVGALREERRERARRERMELEAAWQWLATDGPVRLSSFGRVEHGTLRRLLDLIGRALAVRPGSDGLRRARTTDGRIEVRLWPPPDGRVAELRTPRGRFRGPDYTVDVRFIAAGPARKASGA